MVVAQGVDALGAAIVASVEALSERIHARINLQHAATVAGGAWRGSRARYTKVVLVRAHPATGATADAGVVAELAFLVLLLAAKQEPQQEANQGDTCHGTDNNAGYGAAAKTGAAARGDGLLFVALVASCRGCHEDRLGGSVNSDSGLYRLARDLSRGLEIDLLVFFIQKGGTCHMGTLRRLPTSNKIHPTAAYSHSSCSH